MPLAAMTLCRRLALAVALAASAGYPIGQWFVSPGDGALDDLSSFGFLAAVVMSLVLLAVAILAERPAVFIVRPTEPSFSAPPSSHALLIPLALTVGASGEAGSLVGSVKSHDIPLWDAVVVVWIVGAGVLLARAWRGLGVHLRPEGLRWRELTGSVSVPWDALAPDHPLRSAARANTIALTYARPELVRRRGLVLGHQLLSIDNVAAWFIADAIRHYVTHPERRAAIGTEAEYGRLLYAIRNELTDPPARPGTGSNP
ncbi:hypothetical protein Q2K19_19005 [Micromonospora soli]|uniref:hypothetical protein n=1 Tax=Micromonospora sp. NBRC 110009 TaxID=3061627 RepID=UPI002672A41A|nr:hypothetical protein [Micromonospora sp. NBRC 110009]WKT96312.1 hypothetical protein Q2K19_19005 [Micromonospora sp. NBRC 110009]